MSATSGITSTGDSFDMPRAPRYCLIESNGIPWMSILTCAAPEIRRMRMLSRCFKWHVQWIFSFDTLARGYGCVGLIAHLLDAPLNHAQQCCAGSSLFPASHQTK